MAGDCVLIGGLWESEIELQNRKTHKVSFCRSARATRGRDCGVSDRTPSRPRVTGARLQDDRLMSDLSIKSKQFEKTCVSPVPFFRLTGHHR